MHSENIQGLIQQFRDREGDSFSLDEVALSTAIEKGNQQQPLYIKVISIAGGLFATIAFTAFLMLGGLYNSGIALLLIGGIYIAVAVAINHCSEKIILDACSIALFITGLVMLVMGLSELGWKTTAISILCLPIALGTMLFVQSYLLAFVAALIIHACIFTIIATNEVNYWGPVYTSILALLLVGFVVNEAKLVSGSKRLTGLYNPVRMALIFAFLSNFIVFSSHGLLSQQLKIHWIPSIVIIPSMLYLLLFSLFKKMAIQQLAQQVGICLVTLLVLLPTVLSPAIAGALLVLLLCFWINDKTGLVVAIAAFIYFVSQYYYDLQITLLIKSILLFTSGVLFLLLYLVTYKNLTGHEKI